VRRQDTTERPGGNEIDDGWRIPDELWARIELLLAAEPPHPTGGRPWISGRQMLDVIFYVLRTGCQWKVLPRCFGAPSAVHDRLQSWCAAGVFSSLWQAGLPAFDEVEGIDWEWQAMDGVMTKASLEGGMTHANSIDRAKSGTKRLLLTEGHVVPIGLTVARQSEPHEAGRSDAGVERPEPSPEDPQHLSIDKGYDYDAVREMAVCQQLLLAPPGAPSPRATALPTI